MSSPFETPERISKLLDLVESLQSQLLKEREATPKFSPKIAQGAAQLARAMKDLSTESRQWATMLENRATRASLAEKMAAVQNFILQLSTPDRKEMYGKLRHAEGNRPDKGVWPGVAD
jgi:hypothetical protein